MKATILLATLKKEGLSNTEVLAEFLAERMRAEDIDVSTVKLVDHEIPPGTYSDMGDGDDWPDILPQLLASDIIIFATPIWWSNVSSLMQRVIERLDEQHDHILEGKQSGFEDKVAGVVITGDSDGAQALIALLANFTNAIGMVLPPFATLSVLWDKLSKGKATPRAEQLKKYEKDYGATADKMVAQMLAYAKRRG